MNVSSAHGTPLLAACKSAGCWRVVQRLLALGADPRARMPPTLNTCLHLAALHSPLPGQPSVTKLLVGGRWRQCAAVACMCTHA